jgi:hypothetical protein
MLFYSTVCIFLGVKSFTGSEGFHLLFNEDLTTFKLNLGDQYQSPFTTLRVRNDENVMPYEEVSHLGGAQTAGVKSLWEQNVFSHFSRAVF